LTPQEFLVVVVDVAIKVGGLFVFEWKERKKGRKTNGNFRNFV
jgi:hypothetical protein